MLVTGSSRGLGRGIAVELARGGYSVAVQYAGDPGAASLTAELCARASRDGRQEFPVFRCDIADAGSRERLAEDVFGRLGGLEALVNNAGIAPRVRADILDAGEDSFDELVRTNVRGPYFLTQSVVRRWLASGTAPVAPFRRSVVFITSVSARTASVNRGDYCISKAALSMAARLWAVRLAGEGIPVYEVRPGIMRTDMTSGVTAKYDALIAQGLVPQMRWGSPEDVGSAVRALLDGSFPFSTGSVVDVDGGLHIPRL